MMRPITSSMFSHIGYDEATLTLTVRYKKPAKGNTDGDLWTYSPVIPERYAEMEAVAADPEQSIGKWFRANIAGQYKGEKVEHPWEIMAAELPDIPDSEKIRSTSITAKARSTEEF